MIMINYESTESANPAWLVATDGAPVVLRRNHRVIVGDGHTVISFQVVPAIFIGW
jgi:hypothetical protein